MLRKAKRRGPKKPKKVDALKELLKGGLAPLPKHTHEWGLDEELLGIITGAQRAEKRVHEMHRAILDQKNEIINKDAEIERRGQSLVDYGDHTGKCEWIEEVGSGRLLEGKEADLCTCGWMELKTQLDG